MSLGSEPEKNPPYPTGYVPRKTERQPETNDFFGKKDIYVPLNPEVNNDRTSPSFGGAGGVATMTDGGFSNMVSIPAKVLKSPGVPMVEKDITIGIPHTVAEKHNHYYKDVSKLKFIDVYRVLGLFNVTDPCIQHAVKKLLVAGGRGAGKDIDKDIQEAIDSLVRYQEMGEEDKRENE